MKIVQVTMYEDCEGIRHENKFDCIRSDICNEITEMMLHSTWDILDNAERIHELLGLYLKEKESARNENR